MGTCSSTQNKQKNIVKSWYTVINDKVATISPSQTRNEPVSEPETSCHYADINNIYKLAERGFTLRKIEFPVSDRQLKQHQIENGIWVSNIVIFQQKYDMTDISVIKQFNLYKNPLFIKNLIEQGNFSTVATIIENGLKFDCNCYIVDIASANGCVRILELLKKNYSDFLYNHAIDWASENGHLDVLNWFLESGLPFRYEHAIDWAAKNKDIKILDWFKSSGLNFKYKNAIDLAAQRGSIDVLNWFADNKVEFKYTFAITWAIRNNNNEVIKWFNDHELPMNKNSLTIIYSKGIGNTSKPKLVKGDADVDDYLEKLSGWEKINS